MEGIAERCTYSCKCNVMGRPVRGDVLEDGRRRRIWLGGFDGQHTVLYAYKGI